MSTVSGLMEKPFGYQLNREFVKARAHEMVPPLQFHARDAFFYLFVMAVMPQTMLQEKL
jgi:hypothetical protein